jgi:hypothetical protein
VTYLWARFRHRGIDWQGIAPAAEARMR